jgi:predicted transglutaminase-like cysteine proteinase
VQPLRLISVLLILVFGCRFAPSVLAGDDDGKGSGRLELVGAELGPFAYTHFCLRYPEECRMREGRLAGSDLPALTPERRSELDGVNAAVNRSITPRPHAGRGTYDTWTIAPSDGDCNDFAVTKRHELLARGWPSRALLLAEVVTAWGDHHLVLVARTIQGDLVLDNLSPRVRDWTVTGYAWLRAQMPTEPALWARVAAPAHAFAARAPATRIGKDYM